MALEAGFVQFDRVAIEERFMAFAAFGLVAGPIRRNAVDGNAMRADDMQRVAYTDS
jgi:hypothetical protein